MRRHLIYEDVLVLVKQGHEIYTRRDKSSPYQALHYELWSKDGKHLLGNIHWQSIQKLIRDKVIHGTDQPIGKKYKLIVNEE